MLDAAGKDARVTRPHDSAPEFWIEGRDFYLNGTRLHLSAVPLDNAQIGAALSTYQAARESLERLKSIGINFVYTHNYDCEPGSHLSFSILRAADDVGMLVALTQPHFSHYDWKAPDADEQNGYARHAAFYARVAQDHPSVVMYAMSHNATGYEEDMNPDMIDGLHDPRDTWSARNAKLALRAEAIVNRLDPGRIVYHHASGNLGSLHAINFYPNFVPIQELSDWFGHWATQGVKPAFMCEYGAPFTWDWTMYRGWYQGQREFGSAKVPWEFCLAEWNTFLATGRSEQRTEQATCAGKQNSFARPSRPAGLSQPGSSTASTNNIGVRDVSDGQLARLSYMESVRDFPVGIRSFLEAARRHGQASRGVQSGLGKLAATRIQSGL